MDNQPKIRPEWVPEAYKEQQQQPTVNAAPCNPPVYHNPFLKKPGKKNLKAGPR
ncbi:hypothetical protein [Mucilaginibacter psychrotolerans]|uniref:hypothetical protein n=1 Tax=Mucilaginibacter psychrotolerans TaxID=1524096 RepID=UPI0013053798|nr:hypothetical protein [Mucilaginibacter psychrotolerans]